MGQSLVLQYVWTRRSIAAAVIGLLKIFIETQ